jgi:hypothetical protein
MYAHYNRLRVLAQRREMICSNERKWLVLSNPIYIVLASENHVYARLLSLVLVVVVEGVSRCLISPVLEVCKMRVLLLGKMTKKWIRPFL